MNSSSNRGSQTASAPMDDEPINFPIGPDHLQLYPLPLPDNVKPRPLTSEEEARIDTLSRLQFFLATAPTRWQDNPGMITSRISKFQLPNGECISCVLWNGLYHVTGTDIVRALAFRFEAFGRPIHATKKWEEGVFSDLRNLKPGQDACLEDPKSPLLDFLFRNGCIRTQKKQKVFYWFSVPHDRLFLDALERDLKREKINQEPTSIVVGEPARSFRYDPRRSLYDQFAGQNPGLNVLMRDMVSYNDSPMQQQNDYPSVYNPAVDPYGHPMQQHMYHDDHHMQEYMPMHMHEPTPPPVHHHRAALPYTHTVFEGSPHYKRRRTKARDTPESGTPMSESARGPSVDVRDTESPGPGNIGDSSFASDDSNLLPSLRKKPRDKSRARSRLSSRAGSRAGSADPRDGESRNFLCPYDFCHRPFKRLEHLKRHVRTHTQERPYVCQRCNRNFSRQDNLAMHLKTHEKMDREGGVMSDEDRRYSESPGPDMMYEAYSRSSSAMPPPSGPYTRHSTLPPNFSSGAPAGGSPFQRSVTPTYGGSQMLNVPTYGSPYDAGRRHRSATPYAPATSSNLAYAQPVIAPAVDMMGAYPTPISANDGGINYALDAIPMDLSGSQDDAQSESTPMSLQHNQMPSQMQIPMDQQMQMSMHVPVEMQMPMQDYGGMQYDNPTGRGGAPMGWGWRSYEPGALVGPEQGEEGGGEYAE